MGYTLYRLHGVPMCPVRCVTYVPDRSSLPRSVRTIVSAIPVAGDSAHCGSRGVLPAFVRGYRSRRHRDPRFVPALRLPPAIDVLPANRKISCAHGPSKRLLESFRRHKAVRNPRNQIRSPPPLPNLTLCFLSVRPHILLLYLFCTLLLGVKKLRRREVEQEGSNLRARREHVVQ